MNLTKSKEKIVGLGIAKNDKHRSKVKTSQNVVSGFVLQYELLSLRNE